MTRTLEQIQTRNRVTSRLAYLMAADALDAAQIRIVALAKKVNGGVFNERIHMEAVGSLERALSEVRRAELYTRSRVEDGGNDAA